MYRPANYVVILAVLSLSIIINGEAVYQHCVTETTRSTVT